MDSRQTLRVHETFAELLHRIFEAGDKAHLLIDDNGITRLEGFIDALTINNPSPFMVLENGTTVPLQTIVAVNGIFRPEYGEC